MTPDDNLAADRLQPPPPAAAKRFGFPQFEVHRLSNGLRIYLASYPRGPLIHQALILPGGGQEDPLDRAGLASLTASLLDEGTASQSSTQIARQVESLGGYLSSRADWDSITAYLGVLAKHQRQGLDLVADIATSASFPPHELDRLRDQHLAEIQRRQAQPSTLAAHALADLLYTGTIYATPLLGTKDTVADLDRENVLTTARRHTSPHGSALIVVGDLDPSELMASIETSFGDWQGDAIPPPSSIEPVSNDTTRITLVDRPDSPQTELWLGHIGPSRDHPDRAGLAVLNSLLGGKFTSRINLNLREKLGITYGASSSFSQRRGPGPFLVEASVDSAAVGKAVEEILFEMSRLQDELVSEEELNDTKSYLIGVFPYTLQRIEGLADCLGDLALYNLSETYFSEFFDTVATVTREQLQDLAQKHLQPARVAIAAAGPKSQVASQLEGFGALEIQPAPGVPPSL